VAAVALAPLYPAIRAVNQAVVSRRSTSQAVPEYGDPRPNRQRFFQEVWKRGRDVEFGLIAIVTVVFCMAPLTAASAVVMLRVLRQAGMMPREALLYALAYAFATPVFFRTGTLSHNLMEAHATLLSFAILMGAVPIRRARLRDAVAGLAAGATVLIDYSGVLCLAFLGAYLLVKAWPGGAREVLARGTSFALGAAIPVAVLSAYLYQAFGHPLYPGQHYMERPEWLPAGYPNSGFVGPTFDLLWRLLLDPAYGLFLWSPLLAFALAAPFIAGRQARLFGRLDHALFLGLFVGFWLFFASTYYTTLQWNAGLRYLLPSVPFVFLAAVEVLRRLPTRVTYFVMLVSVVISWSIAMVRYDAVTSVLTVFITGPTLRALTVLSQLSGSYFPSAADGVSPIGLFALLGAVLFGVWSRWDGRRQEQRL
jgi:hypothetical protein